MLVVVNDKYFRSRKKANVLLRIAGVYKNNQAIFLVRYVEDGSKSFVTENSIEFLGDGILGFIGKNYLWIVGGFLLLWLLFLSYLEFTILK